MLATCVKVADAGSCGVVSAGTAVLWHCAVVAGVAGAVGIVAPFLVLFFVLHPCFFCSALAQLFCVVGAGAAACLLTFAPLLALCCVLCCCDHCCLCFLS